jgi:DNA-binding CsgD family transcriptional regulator
MLADAIQRVHDGQCVIDPELVNLLLQRPATRGRLAELTPREREVLTLLAKGLTVAGIAERPWLSRKTVETHIRHILSKLNLPNDTNYNRRVLAVLTGMPPGSWTLDRLGLSDPAGRMWCPCPGRVRRTSRSSVARPSA